MKKICKTLFFICGCLQAISAFSQKDTTPPFLHSISVSPAAVNNGDSITVFVEVTDDISGVHGYGFSGIVKENHLLTTALIHNPDKKQYAQVLSWKQINGNMYAGKAKISDYAMSGIWRIYDVTLVDYAGNSITKYYKDHEAPFFQVNSSNEDVTPPVLNAISISPAVVQNGDSITVTIDITDDISGINGIGFLNYMADVDRMYKTYATIASIEPGGTSKTTMITKWKHVSGSIYTGRTKIPDFASGGTWSVQILACDKAKNNISAHKSFQVNASKPDITPPVLHSLTVSPQVLSPGDTLTVTIDITDDVSGVSGNGFSGSNTEYISQAGFSQIGSSIIEDTVKIWKHISGNIYTGKIKIAENIRTGRRSLAFFLVSDLADNVAMCEAMIDYSLVYYDIKDRTTAVEDISEFTGFTYYTNPVRVGEILAIKAANITRVTLFTLTGRKVSESDFNHVEEVNLSLEGHNTGTYLLKVQTSKGVSTQKLIIQ